MDVPAVRPALSRVGLAGVEAVVRLGVDERSAQPFAARIDCAIEPRAESADGTERFETAVAKLTSIIDAAHLTGRFDYQLRVVCADPSELDGLLRVLKRDLGVAETDTRIVLRSVLRRAG